MSDATLAALIPPTTEKDHSRLIEAARMIATNATTIKDAMVHAGYTETQAKLGTPGMPDFFRQMILAAKLEHGRGFAKLGQKLDPQHVEQAIAGKLYSNMLDGVSDGNEAARLLGTMRKHSVFEKDSMTGVIVLAAPSITPAGKPLQAIDASDVLDGELVGEEKLLPE